jgi:hypothetical protein
MDAISTDAQSISAYGPARSSSVFLQAKAEEMMQRTQPLGLHVGIALKVPVAVEETGLPD